MKDPEGGGRNDCYINTAHHTVHGHTAPYMHPP
jgi:hypothetical protein